MRLPIFKTTTDRKHPEITTKPYGVLPLVSIQQRSGHPSKCSPRPETPDSDCLEPTGLTRTAQEDAATNFPHVKQIYRQHLYSRLYLTTWAEEGI